MPSEYLASIIEHKRLVSRYLLHVVTLLQERSTEHDLSKFGDAEFDSFERMTPILSTCAYGSVEYQAALEELGPALTHHYAVNRHHPEHHPRGVDSMNLIDLIEMVCDWLAAMQRTQDGSINQTMLVNKARFGLEDQTSLIIASTMHLLKPGHGV